MPDGSYVQICMSLLSFQKDFPGGSDSKVSVYNAGDLGSIPALGISPGEGNGNPLQDYCLGFGIFKSSSGDSNTLTSFENHYIILSCLIPQPMFAESDLFAP